MKKAAGLLCILLKGFLFTGFSVQIILGLVWMCLNFIESQQFGEPRGYLYPLLLGALGKFPQILYLLQLCMAGFAGYSLLKPILPAGRLWRIWCVLALMTLPMAMQCHLALLPYSLIGSFFMLELCCLREAMSGEGGINLKALAGAGVCWSMLALLLWEYKWLGLLPMALFFLLCLHRIYRNLRRLAYTALLLAAFCGIVAGLGSLTRETKEYERTFWFSMASRMTWPTIWQDYDRWPQELIELVPVWVCWETHYLPDNMEKVLQPAIENAVGREEAQECYRKMAGLSWSLRKTRIVRQIGWDMLIYAVPQAVLQEQLKGVGYDSYSGRNYEIMAMEHPILTKRYVDYSCWWFAAALWCTVLFSVALKAAGRRLFCKNGVLFAVLYVISAGGALMYYVMSGSGIADYKCMLAMSSLWIVPALFCMRKEQTDEGEASHMGKDR